ncbi:S-adenosyl-L-methionine-dependent methyltransferase [Paraphysoderma sedebokerense]|nr:S-adenosyl-L-methionine-dependent methyltransferase [Paraphysoderma sedebokerense]
MAPTNPALTQHAVPVQLTNDSAIVSKHSSESKGYIPTNQYISHVVAKPAKRSPLINRGYYLRMKLLDTIVQRFLEECSDRKERPQIINIGCGYDPTAFRILSESSVNTPLFIDIDFPELANRKTDIIISDQKLSGIIFPFTSPHYENAARISFPPDLPPKVAQAQAERFRTYTEGVRINSQNYKLIGCDLSQGEKLRKILDTVGLDWEKPILVLSEVVLTYVPRHIADIVISFFGKNCKNGLFIMYEQHIPTFPSIHGFTHTMLQHFDKLNSSLKCVSTYPTMRHAVNRFLSLQWSRAEAMDLHTYWNQYVDCLEHDRVADLELFDEFEEISLKFGGYFVAVAGNGDIWDNVGYLEARRTATLGAGYLNHADPTISGNPHLYPRAERHDLVSLDEVHLPHLEVRSHSSAIIDDDVIIFGGFGSPFQSQYTQVAHRFPNHTRQYTTIVYNLKMKSHDILKPSTNAHEKYPPALQFHTLTPSSSSRCVYLFGGRTNPSKSFNDTYVFHMDSKTWEMVATSGPTPSPRFRHSAVLASLNGKEYLIVHGGRDATTVFDDLWALDLQAKIWISLVTHYDNQTDALPPRFAFEMAYVAERNSLFVYGGLQDRAGAKAVPGLHQIRIAVASDSSVATTIKAVPTSLSFVNSLPVRFGCKMVTFPMNPHKLIVVGGISGASEGSFVPFDRAWIELDISSMTWRYLNAETPVDKPYIVGKHRKCDNEDGGTEEGVEDIEKVIRTKLNPLMLFNMSVDVWGQNSIVVTGGGGTCFSFGSRFDPGIRVWKSHIVADERRVFESSMVQRKKSEGRLFTPPFEELRRMAVNSEEEWLSIYNERTPVVMSNLNFGDALAGWDSGYLKRQVGDKKVSLVVVLMALDHS